MIGQGRNGPRGPRGPYEPTKEQSRKSARELLASVGLTRADVLRIRARVEQAWIAGSSRVGWFAVSDSP
jgi:hypothetical protein